MQNKSTSDTLIAIVAITGLAGIAKAYFNIGAPVPPVVQPTPGTLSSIAREAADAAVDRFKDVSDSAAS